MSNSLRPTGAGVPIEPKAALLALIVGAVDRLDRAGPDAALGGEIRLFAETSEGTLSIVDGGAGLSPADVEDGQGTVAADAEGFWAGLLSCLPLCSRLEVLTRPPENGEPGSRILCADGRIEINRAALESPGTTLSLRLLPEHRGLLAEERLTRLIRKSCDLVRFPIYLGRGRDPLNRMDAPWDYERPEPELQRALRTAFQIRTLLATFPLQAPAEEAGPKLRGVLYVRPRRHSAALHLYCRRVFVTVTDAALLGPGLRDLVSGAIDVDLPSRAASPTILDPVSPEGAGLRQLLVRTVAEGLLALARQRRKHFQQLMEEHGPSLKAACLAFPEELGELRDHLSYRTSLRKTAATLPEVLGGRRDRTVIYADDLGVAASLLPLYGRSNTEVVYMTDPLDEKLRAEWRIGGTKVEFQRFDLTPPGVLPRPSGGDEARLLGALGDLFRSTIDSELQVELATFGPDGPPAVLSITEHDRRKLEMLEALRSRLEQGRREEVPQFWDGIDPDSILIPRTLLLNRSHRIVARLIAGLAAEPGDQPAGGLEPLFVRCLYAHALLSSGLHLPRARMAELTRTLSELITNLLSQTD